MADRKLMTLSVPKEVAVSERNGFRQPWIKRELSASSLSQLQADLSSPNYAG